MNNFFEQFYQFLDTKEQELKNETQDAQNFGQFDTMKDLLQKFQQSLKDKELEAFKESYQGEEKASLVKINENNVRFKHLLTLSKNIKELKKAFQFGDSAEKLFTEGAYAQCNILLNSTIEFVLRAICENKLALEVSKEERVAALSAMASKYQVINTKKKDALCMIYGTGNKAKHEKESKHTRKDTLRNLNTLYGIYKGIVENYDKVPVLEDQTYTLENQMVTIKEKYQETIKQTGTNDKNWFHVKIGQNFAKILLLRVFNEKVPDEMNIKNYINSCDPKKITFYREELGKITDFNLSKLNATSDFAWLAREFKQIRNLNLAENKINTLIEIQKLSFLEQLNIANNPIESIDPLYDFPSLQVLAISKGQFPQEELESLLAKKPNLEIRVYPRKIDRIYDLTQNNQLEYHLEWFLSLSLEWKNILLGQIQEGIVVDEELLNDKEKLAPLVVELIDTRTLFLDDMDLTDITPISYLTNLTRLKINKNKIHDITPLATLTNLVELRAAENFITDISPLAGLKELEILTIQENAIEDIQVLKNLKKLGILSLHMNQIKDISSLEGLTKLTKIFIKKNQITDISPLKDLKKLEVLNINTNKITNIEALANLSRLKKLWIYNNPFDSVIPLQNLTELELLDIRSTQITHLSPLAGLSKLKIFYFSNNPCTDTGFLVDMPSLTKMIGSKHQFSEEILEQLSIRKSLEITIREKMSEEEEDD